MSLFFLFHFLWLIYTINLSQAASDNTLKRIDLPDLYNTSFSIKKTNLEWVKNDKKDGIYTIRDSVTNDILLKHVEDGSTQVLVKASLLHTEHGALDISSYEISQDAEYLLLKTNVTSHWRHSTRFNVYIYNLKDKSLFPLISSVNISTKPILSYTAWSPLGHQLAYVMNNDIYITDLENHKRVTFDGSATVFNGVPDWIYEEEVFGADSTLWWSPDSNYIAYLRLNETTVREYQMNMYTTTNDSYPEIVPIKYPKPGSPNPLVSLHVYSLLDDKNTILTGSTEFTSNVSSTLDDTNDFDDNDRIITDVIWATSNHLIFKQVNRIQTMEMTKMVTSFGNIPIKSSIVRTYQPRDGAWVDSTHMVFVTNENEDDVYFLDIRDTDDGYMHLALVNAINNQYQWLTSGDWEVIEGTVVMDNIRRLVYYISTERSPLERHLYKIDLNNPVTSKICLTCPKNNSGEHGYYSASFSPNKEYYILNYEGPGIPTTAIHKADNSSFKLVLQDNEPVKQLLSKNYALPTTRHITFQNANQMSFDAVEILPPDFDSTKKYPVIFHVYGGPGFQMVSYKYDFSWSTYLASKLDFIVVKVDGRGSGYRGRQFRTVVHKKLGQLEAIDQINAARHWASFDYVDPTRIAIWGWSYGGYLTSKVVEANSGVFSVGLAVAPVTDWRFYDSIYTERYMLTPDINPYGYELSAVSNMTGFNNTKYLLIHGTGDDNVHFQNAVVLVDKLVQANIHDYQVQFFPDSAHSIQYHNANRNVYYLLTEFLWKSFGGNEYYKSRKESGGHFSGPLKDRYADLDSPFPPSKTSKLTKNK